MTWRYSLRWKLPSPCRGVEVLASEQVEEGQPAPASVMDLWVAGAGYAVCWIFVGTSRSVAGVKNKKLQLADAIWRKEYIVPPHCLLMNSSKENWRLGLIILAVKQSVK